MKSERRRNLIDVEVVLPDVCRWCHAQDIARIAAANASADDNFQACPYKLLCVDCSKFRGYVGRDLQLHLTNILPRSAQPVRLGGRI